jgi:hypothetical protein
MLPKDFPPRSMVGGYFYPSRDDGTWARITIISSSKRISQLSDRRGVAVD